MAGFDPDVFGAAQGAGLDADVFGAPLAAPASITVQPPPLQQAPRKPPMQELRDFGMGKVQGYDPTNSIAGFVRGSGSIGATILRPFESAQDNAQRRQSMDEALSQFGADPTSTQFRTNKLLAEVAGTSGAGRLVAGGLRLIPGATRALPTLIPAIETGGMSANGATGAYGMANRIAGGAINGGATAGLVDPTKADTGALLGGALAPVTKLAGAVGDYVGGMFRAKPISPVMQQTAQQSVDAGYVIPPNMVAPSLKSQIVESISGKQATQQIASTKNTEVTEVLVRKALGIPADVPLTKATLESLRKTAGKAYGDVASLSPQASADLEALKQARNDAQGWFAAYNRSASPADLAKAKGYRATADALETALEQHAQAAGKLDLIPALREARKQIAKTYTVGRALNDASGTVDARVLGRMYEKGIPLSDGLDTAGRFASAFPSIAKSPQQVGSPAAHNLKAGASMLFGSGAAGTGALMGAGGVATGGLGLLGAAVPFVAPPVARSIMFSGPVQRSLASPSGPGLLSTATDELAPLLYRSGGLLTTYGP